MSDLRKHLDAAEQEYQSLRYPGNLADDVLKTSRSYRANVLIRIGAVAAMAAAMVIVVRVRIIPSSSTVAVSTINRSLQGGGPVPYEDLDETASSQSDDESQTEVASFGDLPAMSLPQGVSSGLDLAPAAPDFSFSAPSFTTLISNDQSSENTSTTKESV